jgi:hypothetical protein
VNLAERGPLGPEILAVDLTGDGTKEWIIAPNSRELVILDARGQLVAQIDSADTGFPAWTAIECKGKPGWIVAAEAGKCPRSPSLRRTERWPWNRATGRLIRPLRGGFATSGLVFGFPEMNITQQWGYDKARGPSSVRFRAESAPKTVITPMQRPDHWTTPAAFISLACSP